MKTPLITILAYIKQQREMIEEIDPSVYDILHDVEKVPNRRCVVRYKNELGSCFYLENVKIERLNQFEYAAIDKTVIDIFSVRNGLEV